MLELNAYLDEEVKIYFLARADFGLVMLFDTKLAESLPCLSIALACVKSKGNLDPYLFEILQRLSRKGGTRI